MKKLITLAALAFAGVAFAGDYHYGEELKCAQCHTMHASRQHGFEVLGGALDKTNLYNANSATTFLAGAPFDKLLVGGTTNDACLSCHNRGGTSGYDVYGAGGSLAGQRSGGALNVAPGATLAAGAPGVSSTRGGQEAFTYVEGMGHSLGSTDTAPGGTFTNPAGFDCGDCHEVHGNPAFRNLGPAAGIVTFAAAEQPTFTVDAAATAADPAYDVTETDHAAYNTSDVFFGYGGGANRMNAYCAKCHGLFHGDTNTVGVGGFKRHPTGNATTTESFAATDARYVAKDVVRPVLASGGDISPGCLSCHKAHGNARAFALIYPAGATNLNLEEGDEGYVKDHRNNYFWNPRVLCQTCHTQGR